MVIIRTDAINVLKAKENTKKHVHRPLRFAMNWFEKKLSNRSYTHRIFRFSFLFFCFSFMFAFVVCVLVRSYWKGTVDENQQCRWLTHFTIACFIQQILCKRMAWMKLAQLYAFLVNVYLNVCRHVKMGKNNVSGSEGEVSAGNDFPSAVIHHCTSFFIIFHFKFIIFFLLNMISHWLCCFRCQFIKLIVS